MKAKKMQDNMNVVFMGVRGTLQYVQKGSHNLSFRFLTKKADGEPCCIDYTGPPDNPFVKAVKILKGVKEDGKS